MVHQMGQRMHDRGLLLSGNDDGGTAIALQIADERLNQRGLRFINGYRR